MTAIIYDATRCIRCGLCATEAECGGVRWIDGRIVIDNDRDEDWALIASTCPTGAIVIEKEAKKMRLAMIGTGKIVGEALTALQFVDGIEVAAIYGRSKQKAERLATEHAIPLIFDDYDELLRTAAVDFVYIGLINDLHCKFARQALMSNVNVIVEKPFGTSVTEVEEVISLARSRGLYVFEAVTPLHSQNFAKIQELLPKLGQIRAVQANYSQYSSRYDRYLAGEVLPAFDPTLGGGALMDINIYNVNVIAGLFGAPQTVEYVANIGFNGVDTSGVLLMKYDGFVATALGAKDSASPGFVLLQGERGWLRVDGAPNEFRAFEIGVDCVIERYELNHPEHRMVDEFIEFATIFASRDFDRMSRGLDVSLTVMKMVERAQKMSAQ